MIYYLSRFSVMVLSSLDFLMVAIAIIAKCSQQDRDRLAPRFRGSFREHLCYIGHYL